MPKTKKISDAEGGSPLRISTIIQQNAVSELEAAAVMRAHDLKSSDRMEPQRFLQMIEEWRRAPARGN
jgi:hypothetical protein